MTDDELQILRTEPDLFKATGLRRTVRAELLKAGRFPKPVRISERCRGWTLSSIRKWLAQRMEEGDHAVQLDRQAIAKLRAVERGERKMRAIRRSK